MKPKLSILIPIYNVEKYLRQCLDSVCKQTLKDIEIICLNDGSTDSSPEIIQEFQSRDSRIVVINKPNSGYGDSMNRGLKKAKGEYIGIVESDDWIDPEAFEQMYKLAKIYDAEVVRANYFKNKASVDTKHYSVNIWDVGRPLETRHHTSIFFQSPAIWASIYQNKFLKQNHIDFLLTPGASYQDTSFNFKVWTFAKRVIFTTDAYLHYRIDNEASSVNAPSKVFSVTTEYEEIERFLKQQNLYEEMAPLMQATKATAYYWNAFRLSPKLLPDFIIKAKEEYLAAREQGILLHEYFGDEIFWDFINVVVTKKPSQTIRYIRRKKLKSKLRSALKKVYKSMHPSFKKQYEISRLLDEYEAQFNMLNQRVKLLTEQLEEGQHE